ncbi:unnamed protein product [Paramecium sonneborni]|uniref:Mitochondrial import inner membrane translocase subunit TIM50 n=1 Tax=Paramecium sonneborni TaxID=65129 RepID=A0A8S1M0F3_9CILI|nr:unnamed protein product [Paramecium sonneborni]
MNQRNEKQEQCTNLYLPQLINKPLEENSKTFKQIGSINTLKTISQFKNDSISEFQIKNDVSYNYSNKFTQSNKEKSQIQSNRAHTVCKQYQFVNQLRNEIYYKNYFIGGIKEILSKDKYSQNLKQMCLDQLNQIYKNVTCNTQIFNSKKQMPNLILSKKYSIAIDLDETLVHSEELQPNKRYDFQNLQFGAFIRPYSQQFLQLVSKHANLFIFTSSNLKYAKIIAQILDPQKEYFQGIFFRDHCTVLKDNTQTKDINIISGDLTKIILIDNNPQCFIPQPFNGIPIIPFLDSKTDQELIILSQFLEREIFNVEDVQPVIKRFFQFEQFRQFQNGVQAFEILHN